MEKTIFLFWRHQNRSKADFARHYIERHAPLGARLTRTLLGYTVNIVEGDGGPDAITEHWLADAMDLLTPDRAYATREDFDAVVADDRTLFREMVLHVAVRETQPVPGEASGAAPGQPTPGAKIIWLYPDASKVPPPPQARRVVDSHIGYKLVFEDGVRKQVKPDFELIRMAWIGDRIGSGSSPTGAIVTREYPFIREPRWGD